MEQSNSRSRRIEMFYCGTWKKIVHNSRPKNEQKSNQLTNKNNRKQKNRKPTGSPNQIDIDSIILNNPDYSYEFKLAIGINNTNLTHQPNQTEQREYSAQLEQSMLGWQLCGNSLPSPTARPSTGLRKYVHRRGQLPYSSVMMYYSSGRWRLGSRGRKRWGRQGGMQIIDHFKSLYHQWWCFFLLLLLFVIFHLLFG